MSCGNCPHTAGTAARITARIAKRRAAGIENLDPDPRLLASEALRLGRVARTILGVAGHITEALKIRKHAVATRDPRLLEQSSAHLKHAAAIFQQAGMREYADSLLNDLDIQQGIDARILRQPPNP
jgi:hypothetical protein